MKSPPADSGVVTTGQTEAPGMKTQAVSQEALFRRKEPRLSGQRVLLQLELPAGWPPGALDMAMAEPGAVRPERVVKAGRQVKTGLLQELVPPWVKPEADRVG